MLDKMAESVKVIVRCRPMSERERQLGYKNIITVDSERCLCSITNPDDITAPPKTFTFDSVYSVVSTTEQIYNDIVYPLVEGVLEGYNSTVFAYGQTGCGKSFTMQGSLQPSSSRGIIPRSFEHIFEAISVVENKKFLVVASFLEIYNEDIRDLLSSDCRKKLDLKESPQAGICIPELSKHTVQNVEECENLMAIGWRNRSTGSTLMNADSSRSHSIFTIALEMMPNHSTGVIRRGKLNLVDLAGSERQAKTGATGERLKEATKINLSLMALGNVISALVDGRSKHIPYRDSKLTRLLQDSLGGNTKTLMIACLSPASSNYDESLSTLRYANRAKNIKNKPRINEDPKDAMLREYQQEIEKLKLLLKQGPLSETLTNAKSEMFVTSNETEKLRNNYENEMLRLKEEYEREQKTKQKLQQDMNDLKKHYEDQLAILQKENEIKIGNVSHQQVLERLRKLQASMIGGERAGDKELKEKRLKKKKAAEKKLEALASALSKVNDEDGVMLKVYDDIQEELKAKTDTLRKYKQKIRGMEREITDLQSEFENERTDYLETIRRSERQLQLYQQMAEKMVMGLKKECNYYHLDQVRLEAVWSDELERWILPDLVIARTKLPPAGQNHNTNWMTLADKFQKTSGSLQEDVGNWNNLSERLSSSSSNESSSVFQRFERRESGSLAGNYFKPRRANELLSKAREDASKAFSTWREYTKKNRSRHLDSDRQNPTVHNSSLNLFGNVKSNSAGEVGTKHSLSNSWNGDYDTSSAWGELTRKPYRLDALPLITNEEGTYKKNDFNILQL